jgi:hypothetical protein
MVAFVTNIHIRRNLCVEYHDDRDVLIEMRVCAYMCI